MATKVTKSVSVTHSGGAAVEDESRLDEAIEELPGHPVVGNLILAPRIVPPPPFGKTPTDISQIIYAAGAQATRTAAPIVSAPIGMGQVPGLALLALPIYIDYSMGNFSLPMQFPPQCMLLWAATLVYASFTGSAGPTDTTFQLGTASGRNDILAADGMGPIHTTAIHPVEGTLPFAADPNPGQCWLTVNNQGNTSGSGVITLIYFRTASNWN